MLTIAIAQMDVRTERPEANLERAREFAAQAREARADVLLLPELWYFGYDLERAAQRAKSLGEGGFAHMAGLAREFDLYLSGSSLEKHQAGVSNTMALYAPDGALLGSYRKIHRFRLMEERKYLFPGDRATLCSTTPWGPTGLAICYDLRFPELFRVMALAGARLFLVPAQWPVRRLDAWLTLARARAIENELILAACNRVGQDGDVTFPGRSCIVDPWGNLVAEGGDGEELVVGQVALKEIDLARRYLTVYEDRCPEAYRVEQSQP